MAGAKLIALCCVYLFLLEPASALRCRTGVQEMDDQFRKVLQSCKKQYAGNNNRGRDNDSSSNEDDDNGHSSSNTDLLDKFFMSNKDNAAPNTRSWKEQNNWGYGNDQIKNGNSNGQRNSFNYTSQNWKNVHDNRNRGNNNRNTEYSDGADYDQSDESNPGARKEQKQKQACVVQCLFDGLNMVDHQGFPRQESVTQLMTQNVQNPEYQDFMKEAVTECFYYHSLDIKQDKCSFSKNILSCLDDKSKERCEDWGN